MTNFVFVTEGSHDVSFIGKLLTRKGFAKATSLSSVHKDWKALYPTKFPFSEDLLDRVARFPDVYTKGEMAIGLINSGGDSRLIPSLRNALDVIGHKNIKAAVIFLDADDDYADRRFKWAQNELKELNTEVLEEGELGFPVTVPNTIATLEGTTPSMGVFVFPNNSDCGSLEDILFSCSLVSHPKLAEGAKSFIDKLDKNLEDGHSSLKKMRAGLGKAKSTMGTIATILRPGSSLAVAVEQGKMIPESTKAPKVVTDLDQFLDACLN